MHGGRWFRGTPVIFPHDLWENIRHKEMRAQSRKHANARDPIYGDSAFEP